MKIAVVAANGKAARKIISEAVNRGHRLRQKRQQYRSAALCEERYL